MRSVEVLIPAKPKLAFCGIGWIGRNRMKAAAETGLADIQLLYDPSPICVEEAFRIAPESKISNSFHEAVSHQSVDAVVIATPSALHRDQAVEAFAAGKAVFCQKPLGRTYEEVLDVVNAAKAADKLLGGDFSYRYTAAFQKVLEVIRSGELGKIFAVDLKFHNAYGPDKQWFYNLEQSGGGCVLDLGIHLLDLMLFALEFPEVNHVDSSLFAKGKTVKGQQVVEDFASVTMELQDDVNAQLSCSWNLNAGCDAVIEVSFYGTEGGVAMKNINGSFFDFVALRYHGTQTEILVEPPDDWGGRAMVDWIRKLSEDNSYDSSAEEYLHSALLIDKIYGRK
jgi:predicted dehydrogenase